MPTEAPAEALAHLDERLVGLSAARASASRPERGWLREVRNALDRSQGEIAAKLKTTRQAYADLEAAEERGAISLNSLQRAANAMDCEVVYFVVPRSRTADSFRELAHRTVERAPAKNFAQVNWSSGVD